MSKFVRIASSQSFPVSYQPWREFIDQYAYNLEAVALSESEEAIVDLWLEDPMSFMIVEDKPRPGSMMRRVATGGAGLQRSSSHKMAAVNGWDQEFENAKNHAASVLSQLGKH